MSTTTPRTDEAAYRVWGIENVNASLSRTLETELNAANDRIAELDRMSSDLVGEIEKQREEKESLSRQLSESQAQLAEEKRLYVESVKEMTKDRLADAALHREVKAKLEAQLASARAAIKSVIDSAVEPDKAKFASMVPLEPLRAVLSGHLAGRTSPPASAEPCAASTWQPIETVPKDGTIVNVKWRSVDGECVDKARWNGELWVAVRINPFSGLPYICRNPISWQPLPPPPTQDGKEHESE